MDHIVEIPLAYGTEGLVASLASAGHRFSRPCHGALRLSRLGRLLSIVTLEDNLVIATQPAEQFPGSACPMVKMFEPRSYLIIWGSEISEDLRVSSISLCSSAC